MKALYHPFLPPTGTKPNHTPDFEIIHPIFFIRPILKSYTRFFSYARFLNHTPDFGQFCFALSHLPRNTYKTFRLPGIELKFSPQKAAMLAITLQAVSPTTSQNPETIRCKKAPSISFKINKENKRGNVYWLT